MPSALEPHLQGAWLILTQPEALRGATRTRNSTRAHLSAGPSERLCLSPAQQRSVLSHDRQAFLVPVSGAGALVVADPGAFLREPPAAVAGAVYKTPSGAGAAAKEYAVGHPLPAAKKATDGWLFWHTPDADHSLVPLKALRRRLAEMG
ncbi:MAG: hypothetical protein ACRDY3_07585 [Acidimicrobiales bacterium]